MITGYLPAIIFEWKREYGTGSDLSVVPVGWGIIQAFREKTGKSPTELRKHRS